MMRKCGGKETASSPEGVFSGIVDAGQSAVEIPFSAVHSALSLQGCDHDSAVPAGGGFHDKIVSDIDADMPREANGFSGKQRIKLIGDRKTELHDIV